jgi:hypothetical protein
MRQCLTAQKAAEEIERGAHVYAEVKLFPGADWQLIRLTEFSERRILKLLQADLDKEDAETFLTLEFDGDLTLHQPEN